MLNPFAFANVLLNCVVLCQVMYKTELLLIHNNSQYIIIMCYLYKAQTNSTT